LEEIAPKLKGKMAIGTIDCTGSSQRKFCDTHNVRGYPTLKFSVDGQIMEYPGGRTAEEIVSFAGRLGKNDVEAVESIEKAVAYASRSDEGVVFLAYHPLVMDQNSLPDKLAVSKATQVFTQVARKNKIYGTFLLLDPKQGETQDDKLLEGPFICRVEQHIEMRCVEDAKLADLALADMQDWFAEQNIATVSHLGPNNFNKVGKLGKPLVIGVVDSTNPAQLETVKKELNNYAVNGKYRDVYLFGWFDCHMFKRFLEQFNIKPEDSPQVFVLNVPDKTFWQNATYKLNVHDFLEAVQDGIIPSATAGNKGLEGIFNKFMSFMVNYRPWSVVLVVTILILVIVGIILSLSSAVEDLRPYTINEEEKPKPEDDTDAPADEPKKDK
jgi:hypothetical protein